MKKLLYTLLFVGLVGTIFFSFGLLDAGSETLSSNTALNTVNGGDVEYHVNKQVNNFRRSFPVLFPIIGLIGLGGIYMLENKQDEKSKK